MSSGYITSDADKMFYILLQLLLDSLAFKITLAIQKDDFTFRSSILQAFRASHFHGLFEMLVRLLHNLSMSVTWSVKLILLITCKTPLSFFQ